MKKVVIALGGNALELENSKPSAEAQLEAAKKAANCIVDIIENGHTVILVHGNGPQVGRILIQNEVAQKETPSMPFDVCGAMSQGMIGYHLQQSIQNELKKRNINKPVSTVVTQMVVDKNDAGFANPTKPVGVYYTKEQADVLAKEKGWAVVEDAGRGYRRVVASPQPLEIVEFSSIKTLVDAGHVVICCGGGGIPVVKNNGVLDGVAAVIDKDKAAALTAKEVGADELLILTAVDRVSINFRKPNQKDLDSITIEEATKYIAEGHFAPGSMLPKVEACMDFAKSKSGRVALIASLDKAAESIQGKNGTRIVS